MTALHALCAAIAAHEPGLFELIYGRLVYRGESKDGMDAQPIVVVAPVEEIGVFAFKGSTSIVAVEFPGTLETIHGWTFEGCTSLKSVKFPNSLITIGMWAFAGCTNLVAVDLPASLKIIGDGAFIDCTNLVAAEIPRRPKSFYESAFEAQIKIRFLK